MHVHNPDSDGAKSEGENADSRKLRRRDFCKNIWTFLYYLLRAMFIYVVAFGCAVIRKKSDLKYRGKNTITIKC